MANRMYPSNQAPPSPFYTFAESFNITVYFNFTWETIINIIHSLVHHGGYALRDLLDQEWDFVKMLYDKLADEIEEENKRREKEAAEQEKQNRLQEQQQQQMYGQMSNQFTQPSMPSLPNY